MVLLAVFLFTSLRGLEATGVRVHLESSIKKGYGAVLLVKRCKHCSWSTALFQRTIEVCAVSLIELVIDPWLWMSAPYEYSSIKLLVVIRRTNDHEFGQIASGQSDEVGGSDSRDIGTGVNKVNLTFNKPFNLFTRYHHHHRSSSLLIRHKTFVRRLMYQWLVEQEQHFKDSSLVNQRSRTTVLSRRKRMNSWQHWFLIGSTWFPCRVTSWSRWRIGILMIRRRMHSCNQCNI